MRPTLATRPAVIVLLAFLLVPFFVVATANDSNATNATNASTTNATNQTTGLNETNATNETIAVDPFFEEATYYAFTGEKVAVTNLSIEGERFYLASFDGVESVVLRKQAGKIVFVNDSALLQSVMAAYQEYRFPSLGLGTKHSSIKNSFATVDNVIGACLEGTTFFLTTYGIARLYIISAPTAFPNEYAALKIMENATPQSQEALDSLEGNIEELRKAVSGKDTDLAYSALEGIKSATATLETKYGDLSSSATAITNTFMYALYVKGQKRSCASNASLDSALSSIKSTAGIQGFLDAEKLVEQVTSKTENRAAPAAIKKSIGVRERQLNEASERIDLVNQKYSAIGIGLTALPSKKNELETALENLRQVTQLNDSTAKSAVFDDIHAKVTNSMDSYDDSFIYFNQSKRELDNASVQLAGAVKRYGNTDERIVEHQKNLQSLKTQFNLNAESVKSGNLNVTDSLKELYENASMITLGAATMQPKESELDWVTIGGALVLVLTIIGVAVYLKKYKEEEPPSEVDIRQLQGESESVLPPTSPGTIIEGGQPETKQPPPGTP